MHRFHLEQHLVHEIARDHLHAVVVSEEPVPGLEQDVVAEMPRHVDGHVHLGDGPFTVRERADAEGKDGEVRHPDDVLAVAEVARHQHAPSALGPGELAGHLPAVPDALVPAAVVADHDAVLCRRDGAHHALLGMAPLRLPPGRDRILLGLGKLVEDEGVGLDRQHPARELHALAQRPEGEREKRVVHAEPEQHVGDGASVAGASVALYALEVGDLQGPNFLRCGDLV